MYSASQLYRALGTLLFSLLLLGSSPAFAMDDSTWMNFLNKTQNDLKLTRASVKSYEAQFNSQINTFHQELTTLDRKKGQVMILLGTDSSPWTKRDASKAIAALRRGLEDLMRPFDKWTAKIDKGLTQLADLEREMALQQTKEEGSGLSFRFKELIDSMNALKAQLDNYKQAIEKAKEPGRALRSSLDAAQVFLQSSQSRAWHEQFFESEPVIFTKEAWSDVAEELNETVEWSEGVSEIVFDHESGMAWVVLVQGLGLSLMFYLLGRFCIHRLNKHYFKQSDLPGWRMPLLFFSLCLLFFWCAQNGTAYIYTLLTNTSEFFLASALVSFYWCLRLNEKSSPPNPAIMYLLRHLMFVMYAGLFLQLPALPDAAGALLWALILGYSGIRLWVCSKRYSAAHLALYRSYAFLQYICFGLCIFGYAYLALLLNALGFYILLSVYLSKIASAWFHKLEAKVSVSNFSSLMLGLLSGMGIPVIFLCFLILTLFASSRILAGEHLFIRLFTQELHLEGLTLSIKILIFGIFGYYMVRAVSQVSETAIKELAYKGGPLDKGTAATLGSTSKYLWWGIYLLCIMFLLGFSFTSLAVVAGGLSVGIGFGLQNIVNNFISGLILLFGRAIQVGDTVMMDGKMGIVKQITIRNTVVQTMANATIFVPNSELITTRLTNWSYRGDKRVRLDLDVGVAYGSDVALVKELLVKAAISVAHVLEDPAPRVLFWDFAASSLDFRLQFWIDNVRDDMISLSAVRERANELFREHDIEIAFPQTDIHLRSAPGIEELKEFERAVKIVKD